MSEDPNQQDADVKKQPLLGGEHEEGAVAKLTVTAGESKKAKSLTCC